MTDYEILAIVLLIVTLAFTVHNGTHKQKSNAAIQCQLYGGNSHIEGRSLAEAPSLPAVIIA